MYAPEKKLVGICNVAIILMAMNAIFVIYQLHYLITDTLGYTPVTYLAETVGALLGTILGCMLAFTLFDAKSKNTPNFMGLLVPLTLVIALSGWLSGLLEYTLSIYYWAHVAVWIVIILLISCSYSAIIASSSLFYNLFVKRTGVAISMATQALFLGLVLGLIALPLFENTSWNNCYSMLISCLSMHIIFSFAYFGSKNVKK